MADADLTYCPERTRLTIEWCSAVAAYRVALRQPGDKPQDGEQLERLLVATDDTRAKLEAHVAEHGC
jgi:hypothetical protein